jgi:hypothetical protein
MEDFKNYQRNGLRTKRLQKMGYWSMVDTAPVNSAALDALRGEEKKA